MKLIVKITKQPSGGRMGECVDGESVSLSTWMTDNDVKRAYQLDRSANNIFKIIAGNRFVPLWHKLWWYTAYEGTSVLF